MMMATTKFKWGVMIAMWQCLFLSVSHAFHATTTPPLLDVPVFSLSTLGGDDTDGSTGTKGDGSSSTMNVLTYASPVSIKPHRMWSISLYKGTMSHENFARQRSGVLQLLRPEHAHCKGPGGVEGELIRVLGGSSGREVDKKAACTELGFAWTKLPDDAGDEGTDWPSVLPSCAYYLKLELVGDMIDCGSHEVALCKVVAMVSGEEVESAADELDSLSTRELREGRIISEFGRVIPLEEGDA